MIRNRNNLKWSFSDPKVLEMNVQCSAKNFDKENDNFSNLKQKWFDLKLPKITQKSEEDIPTSPNRKKANQISFPMTRAMLA